MDFRQVNRGVEREQNMIFLLLVPVHHMNKLWEVKSRQEIEGGGQAGWEK
jgi:hypothetical protein